MTDIVGAPEDCALCPVLVSNRRQVVNGTGRSGGLLLIGQGPGEEEDGDGRPFVGRSGQLLRLLCDAAGIPMSLIFRENATRCWVGPGNREPTTEEIRNCRPFLLETIRQVNPAVIVTLGKSALSSVCGLREEEDEAWHQALSRFTMDMGVYEIASDSYARWKAAPKVKGGPRLKKPTAPRRPKPPKIRQVTLRDIAGHTSVQYETGIPIVPSYHPAFLMRGNWEMSSLVIDHFRKAMRILEGEQQVGSLGEYAVTKTVELLQALRDYLLADPEATIYFDTETTGLHWQSDELICISLSLGAGEGCVVPILHNDNGTLDWFWTPKQLPKVLELLKEIFGSPNPKCGHNQLFDLRFLERIESSPHIEAVTAFGIAVKGKLKDTELMHLMVAEALPHNMTSVLASVTDMPYYEQAVSEASNNKKQMAKVPDDILWPYSAADADGLPRMEEALMKQARAEGVDWVLENCTYPMLRVCRNMEERGFPIDQKYFDRLCDFYVRQLALTEEKLWACVPEIGRFRWWVPADLQGVLFKQLGLPKSGRKTDGAQKCDDCLADQECDIHDAMGAEALKDIYAQSPHPIIPLLLELKSLKKTRGTYLDGGKGGWRRHIKSDGRIHGSFKMNKVETGRLAMADPSGQTAPKGIEIHSEEFGIDSKNAFRDVICAPEGRGIMNADWNMLELWGMAYYLADNYDDNTMLDTLLSGKDIHVEKARILWPVDPEMLDSEWRRAHSDLRDKAKVFNFGIQYGLTVFGTAERLHCSEEEALPLVRRHIESTPGLGPYLRDTRRNVIEHGYSENKFGRRRHGEAARILEAMGAHRDLDAYIREHINMPIQSGGSDLHCIASALTDNFEPLLKRDCRAILSVHDSLMFEFDWPTNEAAVEVAWMIKNLWEGAAKNIILRDGTRLGWQVPVELEWGRRWGTPEWRLTAQGKVEDLRSVT